MGTSSRRRHPAIPDQANTAASSNNADIETRLNSPPGRRGEWLKGDRSSSQPGSSKSGWNSPITRPAIRNVQAAGVARGSQPNKAT